MSKNRIVHFVIITVLVVMVVVSFAACGQAAGSSTDSPIVIAALSADPPAVYPVAYSKVACSASAKNGDALKYEWVASDGSIMGEGSTVTWKAPKSYGDFNIMCTVSDSHGNRTSKTVTVQVIVRDPTTPGCCR